MNRLPSRFSDTGLKYYLVFTNVEDYMSVEDKVKHVGGDDFEYVLKKSKEKWGNGCEIDSGEPTCGDDKHLDEIFLEND